MTNNSKNYIGVIILFIMSKNNGLGERKRKERGGTGRHRYFLNELTLSWHDVIASSCNIVIILLHVTKARELTKKMWYHDSSWWMTVTLSQSWSHILRFRRHAWLYLFPHKPVLFEITGFCVINMIFNYVIFFKHFEHTVVLCFIESICNNFLI